MKIALKSVSFTLFVLIFIFTSCKNDHSLFQLIRSDDSGIHFNNKIVENDSINPLDLTNIYNGGGVGIGDFNNDGLQRWKFRYSYQRK